MSGMAGRGVTVSGLRDIAKLSMMLRRIMTSADS